MTGVCEESRGDDFDDEEQKEEEEEEDGDEDGGCLSVGDDGDTQVGMLCQHSDHVCKDTGFSSLF